MKVIDLEDRTIFVDDIIQIYIENNYCPERYNIQTTNGTFLVDRGDYYKVKDYLLSLNNEVEIIEEDKEKPISKLYVNNELQYDLEDKKIEKLDIRNEKNCKNNWKWKVYGEEHSYNISTPQKIIADKINEIIDYIEEIEKK